MTSKIIPNYPNYSITEDGIVRNIEKDTVLKQRINRDGYYRIDMWNAGNSKTFKIHRLIYECFLLKDGETMPECIDHIDNNKLNNSITNLRPATKQQNGRNSRVSKNNKLGHKNICIIPSGNFRVQIKIDIGIYYDKTHKTLELAIADRNAKLLLYHGEFANNGIVTQNNQNAS
jgi:hypothetical protein